MGEIIYTKFSNERSEEFAIQTGIYKQEDGTRVLYKQAEYPQGKVHLENIAKAAQALETACQGSKLSINCCSLYENRIEFEYLKGHTMEEELDSLLEQNKASKTAEKLLEVTETIRRMALKPFQVTPEFEKVFGILEWEKEEMSAEPADIDLIFPNILVTEDGKWNVIDYEWTFFFPVPIDFIVYRALHYYLETASKRKHLLAEYHLYDKAGIFLESREKYQKMEKSFQEYIRGNHVSTGMLYHSMGKGAVPMKEIEEAAGSKRLQVYFDYGNGFSEEESCFLEVDSFESIQKEIKIPQKVKKVRIDPLEKACILSGVQLVWGNTGKKAEYETNGERIAEDSYLFTTSDPNILVEKQAEGADSLMFSGEVNVLKKGAKEALEQYFAEKRTVPEKIRQKVKKKK